VILTGSEAGGTLLTRRMPARGGVAASEYFDEADMGTALTAVFAFTAFLRVQHAAA
jgi:hypothetical protein